MKKRKGIVLALALMLAVCLVAGTGSSSVYAKSKKVYYYGSFRGNVKDKDKSGIISKVYISKNKMIVKGSMKKAYSKNGMHSSKAKYCKKKKRTFKLAKNVKFYQSGGMPGEVRTSKENFVEFCNTLNKQPNGLGFWFVVKNGKVTKVVIAS